MSRKARSRTAPASVGRGRILFVLGGAASGKSDVALGLAGRERPRAFVATGQGLDDEMTARIARHRAARPSGWETEELPLELTSWFRRRGRRYRAILVDCITLWLSNLGGTACSDAAVIRKVATLLAAMRQSGARVVIVSNELGLGLVPMERSGREFRDLAGRANRLIAAAADEVYFVVSGLPVRLK